MAKAPYKQLNNNKSSQAKRGPVFKGSQKKANADMGKRKVATHSSVGRGGHKTFSNTMANKGTNKKKPYKAQS